LEEITYTFESQTWLTALTAAIASDLVTLLFFGTRPCMWLPVTYSLPPATYLPLALFGILLGILAWFYQYCLINIHCWYGKIT
ncbi:chloride channel protein, partial [Oliverpabstia sp. DFI.9.49]|nr:chloride channel protein [Oliverpabstia sp. DFI.9.49]